MNGLVIVGIIMAFIGISLQIGNAGYRKSVDDVGQSLVISGLIVAIIPLALLIWGA